jgi:phytoene dehydrogenase-like protein
MDTDVIIVGAGHNGMVAAWYLAKAGLRVSIFERRPFVGGAAITQELWPGFHFSPCAHMVHGIHPKIIRDLDLTRRGLEVLDRRGNIGLNPDGTYYGPPDFDSPRNLAFSGRLTSEEREASRKLGQFQRTLNALLAPYRLRPPPTLEEVRAKAADTPAAEVLEQALTMNCTQVRQMFRPDRPRERSAIDKPSVGRDPLALAYAYYSIDAADEETGERPPQGYVKGGTGAFIRVVSEAIRDAGVKVHLNQDVRSFLVEQGRVIGIRLGDGAEVRARVTLSNLDPKRTFLKMLAPEHLAPEFRRRIAALVTNVSCLKLLAAIDEEPRWTAWDGDPRRPGQGAMSIHHAQTQVDAMWDDFDAGIPPREMGISFSVPSCVDASLAPPGKHTASAWIFSAPFTLQRGTWDDVREEVAERLIDQITAFAPNFKGSILHYKLRTPLDLERENGLTDGAIWHIQHSGEQLFWNRPLPELAHYRAPLPGLYLCGAGQHPGGEVTGQPGHNAAHQVLRDLR